jgi:hypothetical protein
MIPSANLPVNRASELEIRMISRSSSGPGHHDPSAGSLAGPLVDSSSRWSIVVDEVQVKSTSSSVHFERWKRDASVDSEIDHLPLGQLGNNWIRGDTQIRFLALFLII